MARSFVVESTRILRVDVDGGVWIAPGAAIASRGDLRFDRLPTIGARSITDAAMREVSPLVRASGAGRLYCAHKGSHVHLRELDGETVTVSSRDVLAFEDSLAFDVSLLGHGLGLAAGGLIVTRFTGHGAVALAVHGELLALEVAPGQPLSTDPHATVAWTGDLDPALKTDLSWRSAIGHGGQQPIQMWFEGRGVVLVQPFKDESTFRIRKDPVESLARFVTG